jgi:hypothetical protein
MIHPIRMFAKCRLVCSHLPGWFKSLLPKSALTVEEKAWNAYPYTKTQVFSLGRILLDVKDFLYKKPTSFVRYTYIGISFGPHHNK